MSAEEVAREWACSPDPTTNLPRMDGGFKGTDLIALLESRDRECREECQRVVAKNRAQIERSPGVGAAVQRYGLAVCDDIAINLRSLTPAGGSK